MEDEIESARLTAQVVSAYVENNVVQANELPELVSSVHASLKELGKEPALKPEEAAKPAVSVRRSITPDYLICLECGEKLTSLKLHLRTRHNMTPEQYRAKWDLKPDYPMVAASYSDKRSRLAKRIGLGRKRSE